MKIERLCKCDHCKEEIKLVNDENEVRLNSARYDYCPRCYEEVFSFFESFNANPLSPNQKTIDAMNETNLEKFDTIEELMADL